MVTSFSLFVPVAVYLSVFVCLGSAFIETMNNIIIITVHLISSESACLCKLSRDSNYIRCFLNAFIVGSLNCVWLHHCGMLPACHLGVLITFIAQCNSIH